MGQKLAETQTCRKVDTFDKGSHTYVFLWLGFLAYFLSDSCGGALEDFVDNYGTV